MNKKSITAILVLSLFIITSYASIPLSVCAYTDDIKELETEEFNRELIYYDFEDNVVGKNPYNVAIYAETPATGLVEQQDDNKIVALRAPSVSGNMTGSCIALNSGYSGRVELSIKFCTSDTTTGNQIMFKDLTSGVFTSLLYAPGNGKLQCLKKDVPSSVMTLKPDIWYTFDMIMDTENNTATIKLIYTEDGEYKEAVICEEASLLVSSSSIDYSNLSFRMQIQNSKSPDAVTYVDDISVKCSGRPQITLEGDSTIYMTEGETYTEPGYTAVDAVDGVITDNVFVRGKVDTNNAGEYVLQYDVTAADGTAAETKYRTVVVKKRKILYNAALTSDSEETGYEISNISDGNPNSSWRPGADKTASSFTAVFDGKTVIDRFVIEEDNDNIKSCSLMYSEDGAEWKTISGETSENGFKTIFCFEPVEAKQFKFIVDSADITDGTGISISEAEVYASDESIVNIDAAKLKLGAEGEITENLVLAECGTYGSKIKWESSDTSVITNKGTVIRPAEDTEVTLTAILTYKTAEKTVEFRNLLVRHEESEFNRSLINYDFEDNVVGKYPYKVAIYAEAPATGLVEQLDDNKVVALRVPSASGKKTGSCIVLDRGYSGRVELSVKFCTSDTTTGNQIMFKDLTSGVFTSLLYAPGNGKLQCLKKDVPSSVMTLKPDIWYTFDMIMDTENNTATIKLIYTEDGEYKEAVICEEASLLVSSSSIDYSNLSFRMQIQNSKSPDAVTYVDDISVKCSGRPQITLEGDSTIYMTEGETYTDPGYTAFDAVDGIITEKVVISSDLNADIPGTYTLRYDVTAADGTKAETKYRTVIVKGHNRFNESDITADSETENHGTSNLADGDYISSWQPGADKTFSSFMAVYDKTTVIDRMVIIADNDNIKNCSISYSGDGTTWKTIFAEASKNGFETTYRFEPVEVKQLKFTIDSADTADGVGISICEAESYASDESVAKIEASKISIGAGGTITSDLVLKTSGIYGASIIWSSSDTSVIRNNGSVVRPFRDTEVVLTASVKYKTAEFSVTFPPVTVKANTNISTGGGGTSGGGSSAGKTTGGLTSIGLRTSAASNPSAAASKTMIFNDVPQSHWAYKYINKLAEKGMIDGVGNDNFAPDNSITREAFVKLIISCLNLNTDGSNSDFEDVDKNEWYYPYISSANEKGIINGISDSIFGIGNEITRQDMAVILSRAADTAGMTVAENSVSAIFTDNDSISDYAKKDIEKLVRSGILIGDTNGNFMPHSALTRAQAAKVICTLLFGG